MYLPPNVPVATGSRSFIDQMLSPLEHQVVMLARHDGRATVCPGGPIRRLAARLFGIRRANPLADPRLEALRRYCVGRRLGCRSAAFADVVAECRRIGLTDDALWAAAMLSDSAQAQPQGEGA